MRAEPDGGQRVFTAGRLRAEEAVRGHEVVVVATTSPPPSWTPTGSRPERTPPGPHVFPVDRMTDLGAALAGTEVAVAAALCERAHGS
ncbi:hypothetical protein ABZW03_26775 [Kitasatospora sp. NPDC004799]|uniref:hypothetical protein n=1 Tax=Kitasatospora sp. NPDC004799 TaxID=3154460 RepID=UPI0033A68512